MSQSTDTLKDDIAFMTSVARDGHKPTYAGGEFLLMAGLIFGLTSLAVAASLAGYLPVDMNWLWLGSMVAFAVCLPILIARSRRSNSYRMIGNRTVGTAWSAIGWAIFTIAITSGVIAWRLHSALHMVLFGPIILTLYGIGWAVTASLSDRPLAKVLTVGSYVLAVIVALLVQWPAAMFAAYGAALLLLAALPGAIWMWMHHKAQA